MKTSFLAASVLAMSLVAPSAFAHYQNFENRGHGSGSSCPCDFSVYKVKKALSGRHAVIDPDQQQFRTCFIQDRDMFEANNSRPVKGYSAAALIIYNASDDNNFFLPGIDNQSLPTMSIPNRSIILASQYQTGGDPESVNLCQGIGYDGTTNTNAFETEVRGITRKQHEACAEEIAEISSQINIRCSK